MTYDSFCIYLRYNTDFEDGYKNAQQAVADHPDFRMHIFGNRFSRYWHC
jgi:hypothetical protein